MAAELVLVPEAEQDIAEAYAWYEGRRIGLGEEFLSCVDACFEAVCRTPEMHAIVYDDYRRGLVRRFPYATVAAPRLGIRQGPTQEQYLRRLRDTDNVRNPHCRIGVEKLEGEDEEPA